MPNVANGYLQALRSGNADMAREAYGQYVNYLITLDSKGVDQATSAKLERAFMAATREFQKQYPDEFNKLATQTDVQSQPAKPDVPVSANGPNRAALKTLPSSAPDGSADAVKTPDAQTKTADVPGAVVAQQTAKKIPAKPAYAP